MIRRRFASAGVLAFVALSLQLAVGASALPCMAADHDADVAQRADMSGMSMPDAGTSEQSHHDCGEQENVPTCQVGSTCAVLALTSVAPLYSIATRATPLPRAATLTLVSAIRTADRPPPRT